MIVECKWCHRTWEKTLSGLVCCPHCTKPRTSMGRDGWWRVFWAFVFGLGIGMAAMALSPSTPSTNIEAEASR